MEQDNNYVNSNQDQENDYQYQKHQHQEVTNGVQVELISKFLQECPEAALNVHEYLQKNYSNQQQMTQQRNSTPKRSRPLDDSGGSYNNGNNRRKQARQGVHFNTRNSKPMEYQRTTIRPIQAQDGSTPKENQHARISFEQLKYAVSSNLPCFHVEFTANVDRNTVPSALHASDLIIKELQKNGVRIRGFTLVGWAGKKLKLGVNNKDDYATLVSTDKWPTKIRGMDIAVIKPKFNPDAFALVVRHVPHDLEADFVAGEIQRTIASAERIKRIHYSYQRKTDDYRCDVKDYQEYNTALKLGRIAIGHSWLSITPFYSGNRLTICTKCWRIGHLRNKCQEVAKCGVCLEIFTDNHSQVCKNEPKCAQCDGKHLSLDNQCQVIRDYKKQLKEEVDEAITAGKLHRATSKTQSEQVELSEQDFPALKASNSIPRTTWNVTQCNTTDQTNATKLPETDRILDDMNNKLSKLLESNCRVENKVDHLTVEVKVVNLDVQLHQAVLYDIIEIMKDFTQQFLPASLTANKMERPALLPLSQHFTNRLYSASVRLMNGFQSNRKVSSTSPSSMAAESDKCSPILVIPATQAVATMNYTSNQINSLQSTK